MSQARTLRLEMPADPLLEAIERHGFVASIPISEI